jgi:hypothetical protein
MSSPWLRETTGHSMGESAVLEVSFPPFSALVAEVAFFTKQVGQGVKTVEIGDQLSSCLIIYLFRLVPLGGRVVPGDPMFVSVLTIDQSNERRSTQSSGHIPAFKEYAFFGKLIEVGCLDMWVPHKTIIGPSLIIGKDVENMGRFFCRDTESYTYESE